MVSRVSADLRSRNLVGDTRLRTVGAGTPWLKAWTCAGTAPSNARARSREAAEQVFLLVCCFLGCVAGCSAERSHATATPKRADRS